MTLVLILLATLLAIATPTRSLMHPTAAAVLTGSGDDDYECTPEAAGPESSLDATDAPRTSNYHLGGTYKCRRPVFTIDERNPFTEHLLKAQARTAKQVASQVASRLDSKMSVAVQVEGLDDQVLEEKIAAVYRNELVATLGAGRVLRIVAVDEKTPFVSVKLQKSDSPESMAKVKWVDRSSKGGDVWLDL